MAQPEVESTGDEAQRTQLQQQTLPQLLLEVPLQRGRVLGQQRLYECKSVYFHALPKCAPNALVEPAASWLALRVCTSLPVSLPATWRLRAFVNIDTDFCLAVYGYASAWEGENIFCCGGRLMTGPEPLHLAVSVLLLLGPCLVYYQVVYVNSSDRFPRLLVSLLHRRHPHVQSLVCFKPVHAFSVLLVLRCRMPLIRMEQQLVCSALVLILLVLSLLLLFIVAFTDPGMYAVTSSRIHVGLLFRWKWGSDPQMQDFLVCV